MGEEPDGDDSLEKERVSLTLPKATFDRLLEAGPVTGDYQAAIERAIYTQIELDEADEYTVVKNRE